jgi:ketosteroid isomerase-like protein
MLRFDFDAALSIVEAAHEAWNNGDIDGMLESYVDDMVSITNTGPDGRQVVIEGKKAFRSRFEPVLSVLDTKISIAAFHLEGKTARIRFRTYLRHYATGFEMTGTYREICTFRGNRIWKIEDFHDAARMTAFWKLISATAPALAAR